MAGGSEPGASVVGRALAILGTFDEDHRRQTLTEISRRAGIPRPTTLRLLRQLVDGRALERVDGSTYVIGRSVWTLGLLAPMETDLREVAAPHLQDLQAVTRATVHLAIRDGDQVLYVDRLAGRASVPVVSKVGGRLPLHATGVGKVLLAYAPPDVRQSVLAHLIRVTPYTITSPGLLDQQLARIRRDGYATTAEEMSLGACSVAVPIRDAHGTVDAALGIVVPSLTRERARLSAALAVAAQGIQRELARREG